MHVVAPARQPRRGFEIIEPVQYAWSLMGFAFFLVRSIPQVSDV